MSSGATKPASTPLSSPATQKNIVHTKADRPYEFSAYGKLKVSTSPSTRVRVPRTIRQIAITCAGEAGQVRLNILLNNGIIFSPANGVQTGSVSYTVEIPILVGQSLAIQIPEILTSGLSNLWVGLA